MRREYGTQYTAVDGSALTVTELYKFPYCGRRHSVTCDSVYNNINYWNYTHNNLLSLGKVSTHINTYNNAVGPY